MKRPPRLSTRVHLLLLVVGVLLPTLGFAGFAVLRFAQAERARIEGRIADIAREVAASLDRDLRDVLAAARVLAGAESLAYGDLRSFQRRATEAQAVFGGANIALRDRSSRQVMNTAIPWGAPLPTGTRLAREDALAAETGQPVVSNAFRAPDGRLLFSVVVPLPELPDAGAPRFLSLAVPADRLQRILDREISLEEGMIVGVLDGAGIYVARSLDPASTVGQRAPGLAAQSQSRAGVLWGSNMAGAPALLAYRWSDVSNWRVGVSVRKDVLDAPMWDALRSMALAGLAALALALLAALLVGQRLTRAVRALTVAGDALRAGTPVPAPRTALREVDEVGRVLADAAQALLTREAQRAAADERLRVALLTAPVTAYECDLSLRYRWIVNPPRDLPADALIGKRDDEVPGLGTPAELAALLTLKHEVIQGGHGLRRDLTLTGPDGRTRHYDVAAEPLRDEAGTTVVGATLAALDVTGRVMAMQELQQQQSQQRLLINELNHRVKNTLASVQSIVVQTLRNATDTAQAGPQIQQRLLALAAAHDVLTRQSWEGAALAEVLAMAVGPHRLAAPDRLHMAGPPVWLLPRMALALSLATHELATNAVKYGALRPDSAGQVTITWTLGADRRFALRWEESGGPPVAGPPERRGFGTRLIERGLAHDLGGRVRIDFAREGVVCTVEAVLPAPEGTAEPALHHSP